MSDISEKSLLPAGMCDVLAPDAANEAATTETLVAQFQAYGYQRVKPPLLEFEESLLTGPGAAMAGQTFRLMDPVSQRMMGLRADMTLQVARIAMTRLRKSPRPLRLCYAGQVLRVLGNQVRSERQFGQVGTELIGCDDAAGDAEIIVMAITALGAAGIDELSVDLALPTLVPALTGPLALDADTARDLRAALDRKDAAGVKALAGKLGRETAKTLDRMLAAAGPAEQTLKALAALDLPAPAAAERARLVEVVELVRAGAPDLSLTVDPVENRGFEYHSGVTFTIFAKGMRGELGSGGRYVAANGTPGGGEAATGMTLFMDTVLRAAPPLAPARRIYLPAGTDSKEAGRLRREGWVAIQGFAGIDQDEAGRLGCDYLLAQGKPLQLKTS